MRRTAGLRRAIEAMKKIDALEGGMIAQVQERWACQTCGLLMIVHYRTFDWAQREGSQRWCMKCGGYTQHQYRGDVEREPKS